MLDREALFEKFLDYLQSTPTPPDYLGEAPEVVEPFDPYTMVGEWIALRHEVKQQNKLLQAAHNSLQQVLQAEQAQNAQLQQRLEALSERESQSHDRESPPDQKRLLQELLEIVDALDRASEHWRSQIDELTVNSQSSSFWTKLLPRSKTDTASLREMLTSQQQGVELIRRSLLEILRQRQVVPINAEQQPFDPQRMYAIGRQESNAVPENTVIQEVVRGYLWHNQVLREAQVIVAVKQG
jgi:molecular chaperone GrpE